MKPGLLALCMLVIACTANAAKDDYEVLFPLEDIEKEKAAWDHLGFDGPDNLYPSKLGMMTILTKREAGSAKKPTIWEMRSVWLASKAKNNKPMFKIGKNSYFSTMTLYEIDCQNKRIRELTTYGYTEPYANGSSTTAIMLTDGLYFHIPPTAFQRVYFKSEPEGFCPKR